MDESKIKIRLMRREDYEAVVGIDGRVLGAPRTEYYKVKFAKILESRDSLPVSLVAEDDGGRVLGFVMGELYMGEYGIFKEEATLDTIGVDPDCQHRRIGQRLIDEFVDHLRTIGVKKINTLVTEDDVGLSRFFSQNRFSPSKTINLERKL